MDLGFWVLLLPALGWVINWAHQQTLITEAARHNEELLNALDPGDLDEEWRTLSARWERQ